MPDEESLIKLFRQGRKLYFNDYYHDYYYPLSGTDRMMRDLSSCVRYHVAAESREDDSTSETASPSQPEREVREAATTGTGVIISTGGKIVTNSHVVDQCQKLAVQRNGELPVPAYVLSRDSTNDLALLQSDLQTSHLDVAPINGRRSVKPGESVAVYGFPLAGMLSSAGNVVGGNITALTGPGDDIRFFQISAPIQPGNSGGPLLDEYGNVVGIVNSKLDEVKWAQATGGLPQNVNFAIKASVLTSFLEAHSADFKDTQSSDKLDLTTIAARAQK
jgi:S1-C subfamily serine protease